MSAAKQRLALRDAAQWHARLGAAPGCAATQGQWQAWHQQDALHQWAWQRLQNFQAELAGLSGPLARHTLLAGEPRLDRRSVLKGLLLGIGSAGLAWSGYRQMPVWMADLRTRTGERRNLTLDDGTQIALNTASAVDIRYDANQRLIILRAGEIWLQTAKDPRPLKVRSAQGEMRALGTRFSVRQFDDHTQLDVFEHAVAVRNAPERAELIVQAGSRLDFGASPLPDPRPSSPQQADWRNGRLVIDDWPLQRALEELQRYRSGFIQCAPEVAGLRVSGAFPLDDSDRALAAISQALPVRIETRTRFWVRVQPRS
ncbi:FecR domain-containing protein [Pseudomonas sp. CAN2814]|uniref:FecR domain-containing protein n=1 Tax=Pseudomonas sp. CAN1 TaxID=3046726 RepID=UPI0026497160|nr:FecR domain-containing protein [Pseudomonas sp. CAN1]MDN6858851.1 FecR domain-containing protein [Pseudomonas sp. CAN1]